MTFDSANRNLDTSAQRELRRVLKWILYGVTLLLFVQVGIALFFNATNGIPILLPFLLAISIAISVLIFITRQIWQGHIYLAGVILTLLATVLTASGYGASPGATGFLGIFALGITLSTLLTKTDFSRTNKRIQAVGLAATATVFITALLAGGRNATSLADLFRNTALLIVALGIVILFTYLNYVLQSLATSMERSINLLRIGAEVGQITSGLRSIRDVLPRAVNFIRDRFGFYHVQIFLIDDDGEYAVLRASTGKAGQELLERKHRLRIGSNSVVGQATKLGRPFAVADTDNSPLHYRNELLPNTRSELALPIVDGDQIIGALDVQSTNRSSFTGSDIQALQIMTNLLSGSLRTARLFEQQQTSIRENQRLYIEAETNLREIQRLNRRLTRESWEQFVESGTGNNGVTVEGDRIRTESDWSSTLIDAMLTRQPMTESVNNKTVVAVPISLRGEIIGAIEIEPSQSIDNEEVVDMLQSVSNRLALSLENARLFEDAQANTAVEQNINRIVEQYQSASTVNELLNITLSELADTLNVESGSIRLSATQDDSEATAIFVQQ